MSLTVASALAGSSTQSSAEPEEQPKRGSSINPKGGKTPPILQVVAVETKSLLAYGNPLASLNCCPHMPHILSWVNIERQGFAQNSLHEHLRCGNRPLGIET